MPHPYSTLVLATALVLLTSAAVLRLLLTWITSRTAIGLCALAAILAAARAFALQDWPWNANFLLAAIILVLAWLTQPSADQ
ncbi:hypothetical protein ABT124_35525 [Streptomyces sp. NPDC001982]|uniref:hypothetical protein n=1 Tax=unclassified Streptomyces TaxID=2593676 RepID=UPI003327032A